MNKADKKVIAAFRKKAQVIINRMAKDREALRDLVYEYNEILDAVDDGIREFEDGIDRISELI